VDLKRILLKIFDENSTTIFKEDLPLKISEEYKTQIQYIDEENVIIQLVNHKEDIIYEIQTQIDIENDLSKCEFNKIEYQIKDDQLEGVASTQLL
jgi:hypothetical protein